MTFCMNPSSFQQTRSALVFTMLFIGILLLHPALSFSYDTVVCESPGGYTHCRADTRGDVEVNLVHKISKSSCNEGRDWGVDRDGIWVDKGCRAKFEIGRRRYDRHPSGSYDRYYDRRDVSTVVCESPGGYRLCRANTRDADVRIVDKMSKASCNEGRDWGVDRDGIWVDRGCRARFEVSQGRYGGGSRPPYWHDRDRYDRDRHDHHHDHRDRDHVQSRPETCPPGSRPGRCTDKQRRRGCKDWRQPGGLGCFTG